MPVCIIGMHRSGTSMVTRLLNICGLYLGKENNLIQPEPDNPEGFWENHCFVHLNDKMLLRLGGAWDYPPPERKGWENQPDFLHFKNNAVKLSEELSNYEPWGWKDPRNSLTIPFWLNIFPGLKFIICLRNPLEVASSLNKRGYSSNVFGFNLWHTYNKSILNSTTPQQRVITHYESFFIRPKEELERLLNFLDMSVPAETIDKAYQTITHSLRHYSVTENELKKSGAPKSVMTLYENMCSEAGLINHVHQYDKGDKKSNTSIPEMHRGYRITEDDRSNEEKSQLKWYEKKAVAIAFYLPQFHPIPENDIWWGKGFTDWINVAKATLRFPGHYQPHIPADLGFYDLRLPEVRKAQSELAREYGIDGFCYYHYWFHGKRLLHYPIDEVLVSGEPDFPFCLCWANENWTRAWDGQEKEILMRQGYSAEDHVNHIRFLCQVFRDRRYIRVNGRPLFLVYRAKKMPDPLKTTAIWREESIRLGIGELFLCRVERFADEQSDPKSIGFDAAVEFQPDGINLGPRMIDKRYAGNIAFRYEDLVKTVLKKTSPPYKRFPCVCPSWDNSPRRQNNAVIFIDSTPELYRHWLLETIKKLDREESQRLIFINAWNEWGEGCHLEPDERFGKAYLEATRYALLENGLTIPTQLHKELDQNIYFLTSPEKNSKDDHILIRPLVSIVIPVFNKVEYTKKCINSIIKNTCDIQYEIIIIDNASTDETKQYLNSLKDSRISVISNEKNLGFAAACNQGAQEALSEYILFLNNDTETTPRGWLEPLIEILDNDEMVAAVGSKLLFPDNTIQHAGVVIFNDRKLPDPLVARHIYYKQQSDLPEASQKRTYQALTAACLLIRKSSFDQVGGFDEVYWNGYEDIDLCFKFQENGWKLVYQPESVLIHHESKSGPERFSKVNSNIERLHKRWLGKIKPDCIIGKDGSVIENKAGHIKPYSLPGASESTKPISLNIQKNLVSIIILTFNQIKYTKECVESIRNHTPELHEIIFVDNGSTDGTVKWLRKLLKENPNYKLIENHKNLGFPKGCNQGLQASAGEYILLLNNDVVVTNGWLSGMLECLNSSPDIGIVGPMTNNISGNQKIEDTVYQSSAELNVFAQSFKERNRHRRVPSRRIVGFCMLFRRKLVEKIGLLDETFGTGNFEDDDFCLRAALEGYGNFIAGDVFIHHYGSRSFKGNRIEYSSAMTGNRKIFREKWSGIDRKSSLGSKVLVLSALEDTDSKNQKGNVDMAVDALLEGIRRAPTEKRLYYALSEILIDSKQFKDAYEILKEMSFDENDLRRLELIGYCAEGIECYDEAEDYADRALSLNTASAPALNLKGVLAHKKGDKEKAQDFFQRAIEADPGFGELYTNIGVLKWASGLREEALNLIEKGCILSPAVGDIITSYHSAISALARFERAENVFREAQALYPLNRRIAFLLIDTLIQQGKNDIAIKEIEKAMIAFGIDDGILSAALKIRETLGPGKIEKQHCSRVTLSLCMIVKNEEAYIAQCLSSADPVVNEMIIVDTGSTDRTKDIARVFGARIYDFEWTDNFAEARNFSLAQAHGDWILVLDADEIISSRDHAAVTSLIKKQERVGYSFTTRNYTGNVNTEGWVANNGEYPNEEAADGWFPSQKVRLFPRDPRIQFENHVHELVEPSLRKEKIEIEKCRILVHHYGRLDRKRDAVKEEAYYELGKVKLQEKGDDVKALSELAVTAGTVGKYEEAIKLWQRVIAIKPDFVKAFVNLGYVYLQTQRYEDALAVSKRAVELAPHQKETVLNYASAEVHAGDVKKAISFLEHLLNKIPEFPPAMGVLAAAYCIQGERAKGLAYIEKIKKLGFNCPEFLYKHARSLTSAGRNHFAMRVLEAAVESNQVNDDITLLRSQLQSGSGCETIA